MRLREHWNTHIRKRIPRLTAKKLRFSRQNSFTLSPRAFLKVDRKTRAQNHVFPG
jgi:hypothetical protein